MNDPKTVSSCTVRFTVSDIPNFTERGGMIGFVAEPGAVWFRINQATAQQSQLRVSSRLLALGR